jgi:hypothetical protein
MASAHLLTYPTAGLMSPHAPGPAAPVVVVAGSPSARSGSATAAAPPPLLSVSVQMQTARLM